MVNIQSLDDQGPEWLPKAGTEGLDSSHDFQIVARSIQQDFRRVADTLERAIDLVGSADDALRLRLTETRNVAELGLRLSERLLIGRTPI